MGAGKGARSKSAASDARKMVARARSAGRRSALLWIGATILVAAALVVVVVVTVMKSGGTKTSGTESASLNSPPATVAVGGSGPPPWPAAADAAAAVKAAGLPMLGAEGQVEHIHAHLDVIVDGRGVPVPASIGIDTRGGSISPLHTHDDSGIIHIESPVRRQFSLGEFFSEWQVSLSADNIGGLRAIDGKVLRVFVNGKPQTGNPAAITFAPHDEIAVLYGVVQPGESIPSKYDFPQGD